MSNKIGAMKSEPELPDTNWPLIPQYKRQLIIFSKIKESKTVKFNSHAAKEEIQNVTTDS